MSYAKERTALYRIRGEAERLLYVGITNCVPIRWNGHQSSQPWWDELRSLTVEWFDKRTDAEAAEKAAIRAEKPKYNKAHVIKPPPQEYAAPPPRPLAVPSAYAQMDDWASDDGLITLANLATYMRTKPHVLDHLTRQGKAPQSVSGTGSDRKYRPVDVKLWMAGSLQQCTQDPVSSNPVIGPCVTATDLAPAVQALGFDKVTFDPGTPEGRDEIWVAYMACRDYLSKCVAGAA